MKMAGFIHFDCLCGLDIYFFGDLASGEPPYDAIETLRSRLGNHQFAIYSSLDEAIVPCPCCDSLIQLPDAQIAAFFGQMSQATAKIEADKSPTAVAQEKHRLARRSNGYNLNLAKLN